VCPDVYLLFILEGRFRWGFGVPFRLVCFEPFIRFVSIVFQNLSPLLNGLPSDNLDYSHLYPKICSTIPLLSYRYKGDTVFGYVSAYLLSYLFLFEVAEMELIPLC
jgi:hypothetical protein